MLYTCILFQILILTANILVEAKVKNDRRRSVWSFWLRFGSLGLLYIVGHFLNLPIDEFVMFVIANIFIFLLSDNILDFISYKKGRKDSKKIMFHLPITHIVYTLLLVPTLYIVEVKIISYPFIILNAAVLGITAAVCFKFKKQAVLNGARLIGILLFIISASLPFYKSDIIFICLLYSFLFYATDYAAYMGGYPIPTEKIIFRAFVNNIVVSVLFCIVYFTM